MSPSITSIAKNSYIRHDIFRMFVCNAQGTPFGFWNWLDLRHLVKMSISNIAKISGWLYLFLPEIFIVFQDFLKLIFRFLLLLGILQQQQKFHPLKKEYCIYEEHIY